MKKRYAVLRQFEFLKFLESMSYDDYSSALKYAEGLASAQSRLPREQRHSFFVVEVHARLEADR